jgi:hypothetical protein
MYLKEETYIRNQTDQLDVILTGDGLVEQWWGVDTNTEMEVHCLGG